MKKKKIAIKAQQFNAIEIEIDLSPMEKGVNPPPPLKVPTPEVMITWKYLQKGATGAKKTPKLLSYSQPVNPPPPTK